MPPSLAHTTSVTGWLVIIFSDNNRLCSLVRLNIKETDYILYPGPHPGLCSYHLGVMGINQDVGQDVLSEFKRSPFLKGMATSRLNPRCQFISPSGRYE